MLVDDALQSFLAQLRADGRSKHTLGQYNRHIRAFAIWAREAGVGASLGAIDHEDLARFFASPAATSRPDGSPKKATSVNALRTSLRQFFSYVHAAGWLSENPARLLRQAQCSGPSPRAMADEDRRRLFEALDAAATEVDQRDRCLFRLMIGCGLRVGSALGLDIGDVDLGIGELRLRGAKGNRDEIAFIPLELRPTLASLIGDRRAGPLFCSAPNRRLSVRNAQRRFAEWLTRSGIERRYSPHALRHDFATRLYRKTGDIRLVQEALRHRSICSTVVYARCGEDRLRQALGA